MLTTASEIVTALPPEEGGNCVLDLNGELFRGEITDLQEAMSKGALRFHAGSIRGALPVLQ